MSWNTRIRQVHRWSSIVFTAAVVFVTAVVASGREEPAEWVYFLPLPLLGLLLLTGLYLFVLPYATRLRGWRRDGAVPAEGPGPAA